MYLKKSESLGVSSPLNGIGKKDCDPKRKRKVAEITQALSVTPVDVATLRRMAISEGGLLTDEIRCLVWPKLLNVQTDDLPEKPGAELRENNKDYQQVLLDVRRSLRRFPPGEMQTPVFVQEQELRNVSPFSLIHIIDCVYGLFSFRVVTMSFARCQVYVSSLFLLCRDFMDPTMDNTKHILNYLMPIIERVNPEVHDFMQRAEVGTIFALSWLITWFGHVLSDFRHVVRLYDFFLACHPLMPIYFAAVIVLHRESEVLECECDMASVHHLLSQIPQDLPYETLISRAGDLFVQFPPSELAREATQQHSQQTAASTFKDFELAS
uniref:TBC1 domain family, member 20 n=1 Tax=Lepisosteus oculatus TaxID=7918 RepID=W5MI52_LEPOC